MVVLAGLRGDCPVAELCYRHQISQGPYDNWRDRLLNRPMPGRFHLGVAL